MEIKKILFMVLRELTRIDAKALPVGDALTRARLGRLHGPAIAGHRGWNVLGGIGTIERSLLWSFLRAGTRPLRGLRVTPAGKLIPMQNKSRPKPAKK